jgi:signal transduction histidine kinase
VIRLRCLLGAPAAIFASMAPEAPDPGAMHSDSAVPTSSALSELAGLAAGLFSPLAHDLRAGLNGISVWTHLLARDGDDVSQRAVEGIRRAVADQSALAQQLSQFGAVLTAQHVRPAEPVDLNALCTELAGELREISPDRAVTVHAPDQPVVVTHAAVLRQIVRLLLLDAISSTPDDVAVKIALHETAGHLVLEVGPHTAEAGADTPRRRNLRQAMAALAACMLGGYLEILPADPVSCCLLHLPVAPVRT